MVLRVADSALVAMGLPCRLSKKNHTASVFPKREMNSLTREPVSKRNIEYVLYWSAANLPTFDSNIYER